MNLPERLKYAFAATVVFLNIAMLGLAIAGSDLMGDVFSLPVAAPAFIVFLLLAPKIKDWVPRKKERPRSGR